MCKAAVESQENAATSPLAAGLNSGILYMFVMPYLCGMFIVYLFIRQNRKQKAAEADL